MEAQQIDAGDDARSVVFRKASLVEVQKGKYPQAGAALPEERRDAACPTSPCRVLPVEEAIYSEAPVSRSKRACTRSSGEKAEGEAW